MNGTIKVARNVLAVVCATTIACPTLLCSAEKTARQRRTSTIANAVETVGAEVVAQQNNNSGVQQENITPNKSVESTTPAVKTDEQPAEKITVKKEIKPYSANATKGEFEQALPQEDAPIDPPMPVHAEKKDTDNDKIEFHFESAELKNLILQIEELYGVKFITDNSVTPPAAGGDGAPIDGVKISFKTQRPLSRKQAWNLFITFLDMANLAVIAEPQPHLYRIMSLKSAKKAPLNTFIGTDARELPDSDEMIRYIYFVENANLEVLKKVITSLSSPAAGELLVLAPLKAILITDKSYNIKVLLKIIKELDRVTMPQSMSILKLFNVDVTEMAKTLNLLTQGQTEAPGPRPLFQARKQSSSFFPEGIRIIPEPRTNSLILLGPQDAIKKIEDFTRKFDKDEDAPYTPLRVHTLKYARAKAIAGIMNKAVKFDTESEAAKVGGVRSGDKYLRAMTFTPDEEGNRLIIKGDEEDYLKAKEIIDALDIAQPQIALEVLILSLRDDKAKALGAQIRTKAQNGDPNQSGGISGLVGNKFTYQTSGFDGKGIVENENGKGATRLLGDLLKLVTGMAGGNTVVSLGNADIWGVFRVLDTITTLNVVSNPYVITTNKTPTVVSVGETRRVQQATVVSVATTSSFEDEPAKLTVNITPQINSDGMIVLDLNISIQDFDAAANGTLSDGNKITKDIITQTIVADKEVIALGGLVRNRRDVSSTKVPLLSKIPVFGWMFTNKAQGNVKENLLILVSTRIIEPFTKETNAFTDKHINEYQQDLKSNIKAVEKRDPINRWFFDSKKNSADKALDNFIFKRKNKGVKTARRRGERKRKQDRLPEPTPDDMLLTAEMPAAQKINALATKNSPKQPVQQVTIAPKTQTKIARNKHTITQQPTVVAAVAPQALPKKQRSKPSIATLLAEPSGEVAC